MTKRCLVVGALLAACSEEGSLGEYPESSGTAVDDGATDDSGTTNGSASATEDGSATDGTDTTLGDSTDASVTSEDSTGSSSDTGSVGACEQPGNCSEFSACEGASLCGTLDSLFDENGCVRQECGDDDACADDERCYRAIEFGGCAPSGVFCEDDPELQTCLCGSNPECGGGFCVPQELYPAASPLPGGVVFADAACAPNDGAAIYLQWGGFGACDLDERILELTVFEGPLEVGTFEFSGSLTGFGWYLASDDTDVEVVTATIEITAFDGAVLSGTVEATLAPNADDVAILAGDLVDVPYCDTNQMCG